MVLKIHTFYLPLFITVAQKLFLGRKNMGETFAFPHSPPPVADPKVRLWGTENPRNTAGLCKSYLTNFW